MRHSSILAAASIIVVGVALHGAINGQHAA
jgi:hypothetical protein